MHVLIDGDPLVYRIGFAVEERTYAIVYQLDGKSPMQHLVFKDGHDKNKWKRENPDVIIHDESVEVTHAPLSHALQQVKRSLQETREAVRAHFHLDDVEIHIILSGPGNFRVEYSTIREYKGNRKETHKPHWYQQIRNYMTQEFGAVVVEGREADDELSIRQHQHSMDGEKSIICTIDKDLDMVPGWHYDYVRHVFYTIDETDGELWFWTQVLAGDLTDNIPGCPGYGVKTAQKAVAKQFEKVGGDSRAMWEWIVERYEENRTHEKAEYGHITSEAAALETARLVFMQEYPGQLWTPPGEPDGVVEVGLDD